MTLGETQIGDRVKIKAIGCTAKITKKLRAMGITSGLVAEVTFVAPFGTPIAIKADNLRLAIGKAEADKITVEYVK